MLVTYGSEIGPEESLLDAGPEGQRDDEDLVGLFDVLERGHEQLLAGQLHLAVVALILTISEKEKNIRA